MLLLLFVSTYAQASEAVSSTSNPQSSGVFVDDALATVDNRSIISLKTLGSATNGIFTRTSFESVIGRDLIPYGVREVLLDIGWQNFSFNSVPYEGWVNDWLAASDNLGIQNIFYLGQLTETGVGSPWVRSLLSSEPDLQTYYANGEAADYFSIDNPSVAAAIEGNLLVLNNYYGIHSSWIGIGTGYPANDAYYPANESMPVIGYSNSSVESFANSVYFSRDFSNATSNESQDLLWKSFLNTPDSIGLSSGSWQNSQSNAVYGPSGASRVVAMRFYIPDNESGLNLQWYGNSVGNPGTLSITIYPDIDKNNFSSASLSNATQDISNLTQLASWQRPAHMSGFFSVGYYWAVFQCPVCNSSDYYNVYTRVYQTDQFTARYIFPKGFGEIDGGSILWIKNQNGENLALYPFEQVVTGTTTEQFTAPKSFSFNTVFVTLADRGFNPSNATLEVYNVANGSQTLIATGLLSQNLIHGILISTPVSLTETVNATKGLTYMIEVVSDSIISWSTVFRGLEVNPATSGFQNQSQFMLFQLGLINWASQLFGYSQITANGRDSVSNNTIDAVRFSPSSNESLVSVQILMRNDGTTLGNYTSGQMSVSLWTSADNGSYPSSQILEPVTVLGNQIPFNGWLKFNGFSYSLLAGQFYWLAFSTNSNETYSFARLTNSYFWDIRESFNNGSTWTDPAEGPTDWSLEIFLSNENISNYVDNVLPIHLSSFSDIMAEPFDAQSTTEVGGVFLGPIQSSTVDAFNDSLMVSINPDGGNGVPSGQSLTSGILYAGNITLDYGPQFIQFNSIARLTSGQRYWIVIRPVSGFFSLLATAYFETPANIPENSTALQSSNSGFTWEKVNNETTLTPYAIASVTQPLPVYNTSEIYQDLVSNHNFTTQQGALKGWNGYIQSSEATLFEQITSWFDNYTQKSWVFDGSITPNVLSQLGYNEIQNSPTGLSSVTNCSDLANYMLTEVPFQGQQDHLVPSMAILANCSALADTLVKKLNYMVYPGPSFGSCSAMKLLIVGDVPSSNLTGYFSNAFNTKYFDLGSGLSLNSSNLDSYTAVLWLSKTNSSAVETILQNYVDKGGELVAENAPVWLNRILGFDNSGNSQAENQTAIVTGTTQIKLNSVTANTGYNLTFRQISDNQTLGTGDGVVVATNRIDDGWAILLSINSSSAVETEVSDPVVLLSNIISIFSGVAPDSPFWFSPNGTSSEPILFSLNGGFGSPLLLWISNPSPSNVSFSLSLNATYYGLPSRWRILGVDPTFSISGTGTVINYHSVLAPKSWQPLYLIPDQNQSLNLYSSVPLVRELSYPNQAQYLLGGVTNQSSLIAVSYNSLPQNITVNNGLLPASNASSLANKTEGWYFDPKSNTIFMKYVSSNNDSIIIFASSPIPPAPPFLTTKSIVLLIVAAVVLEFAMFGVLHIRSRIKNKRHL